MQFEAAISARRGSELRSEIREGVSLREAEEEGWAEGAGLEALCGKGPAVEVLTVGLCGHSLASEMEVGPARSSGIILLRVLSRVVTRSSLCSKPLSQPRGWWLAVKRQSER